MRTPHASALAGRRLGEGLRELRLRAGLTGYQLSEKIGISQSYVSRMETARCRASPEVVRRWLDATGTSEAEREDLLSLATSLRTTGGRPAAPPGVLGTVGLTEAEERLWLALVDQPPLTLTQVRSLAGAAARAVLSSLEDKGLVVRLAGRPALYTVTAPDAALSSLVQAKEEQLRQVRLLTDEAMRRYRSGGRDRGPEDVVEIVRGSEAVGLRCGQINSAATSQICGLSRPPYLISPELGRFRPLPEGVRLRTVYDASAMESPERMAWIEERVSHGEQARVGNVPVKLQLSDDRVGFIPLHHPATPDAVIVVHSSSLLVAMRTLFELIWVSSVPITAGERAHETSAEHRQLLGYLAAGMTDAATARRLGWHVTTVQRRMRALMAELGVRTRFQAGLQAAKRGWI
ncbi:helix-turn-helix domain-containing protein [Nonomuraea sp. NPDC050790]|uniref:helix-turn-helix domain-containing protein n=1 Tax=Nonomuraea sp. NPDC050790 TaxID=3364371 RepID=UPI0037B2340E